MVFSYRVFNAKNFQLYDYNTHRIFDLFIIYLVCNDSMFKNVISNSVVHLDFLSQKMLNLLIFLDVLACSLWKKILNESSVHR